MILEAPYKFYVDVNFAFKSTKCYGNLHDKFDITRKAKLTKAGVAGVCSFTWYTIFSVNCFMNSFLKVLACTTCPFRLRVVFIFASVNTFSVFFFHFLPCFFVYECRLHVLQFIAFVLLNESYREMCCHWFGDAACPGVPGGYVFFNKHVCRCESAPVHV